MVMGSLPITVPPKEPKRPRPPRRGFFFSGFGFRGTPVPSENLIRHVTGLHLQRKHWWWVRTRQTDLCSEHAPRPVSFRACGGASAQLWHPDQEVNSWIPPTTCVYRKPKLGRSGDEVRQGLRVNS